MNKAAGKYALAVIVFLIMSGFMFHSSTAFAAQKKSSHLIIKKTSNRVVKKASRKVVKKTNHKIVKKKSTYPKKAVKAKTSNKKVSIAKVSFKGGNRVTSIAKKYLGTPYVYGAAGNGGFDCSGLTMYVYKSLGVSLPHSARAQSSLGKYVSKSDLQAGDLVFFATNGTGNVSHVGIYVGSGKFIQAPSKGETVSFASLSQSYYSKRYVTARRIV